jgi:NADH:ubiquinone oxidoreductase subunit 5 (subunit L)/multisubunit Na+/H+ antiporter MnhA subunit
MDALVILIPLMPLLAALLIGMGHLFGVISGEAGENTAAVLVGWAICMSFLLALTLLGADLLGMNIGAYSVGHWLNSDTLDITLSFISTGFNLFLAALFSILLVIVTRFSIDYMHKEQGYYRFFFILSLFAFAVLLLVLSGNAVGTFVGWEVAGLCTFFSIAYDYGRPAAAANATDIFVVNRIGSAAFVLGVALSYAWVDSVSWDAINAASAQLSTGGATAISLCFAVAAFAKSAQLPFTPWLARIIDGPTPSSAIFSGAIMVHTGVYLVILLRPIFEHAPLAMAVIAITGLMTAVYSYIVGLTQTDIKSALVFATSGQLGLMFLECGLGFWQLAGWHLCAHAVVRSYQYLTAPSLMDKMHGVFAETSQHNAPSWLYVASLQRFWLDQLADWALVKPVRGLAHDLSYFDDHVIDHIMGIPAPAIRAISSLAQLEEQMVSGQADKKAAKFAQASGLAGKLTEWMASVLHWFEDRLVLRGIAKNASKCGRRLGQLANKFEQSVFRPRYLVLFVLITLLIAF